MVVANLIKKLALFFLRDYSIYHIYRQKCESAMDAPGIEFRFEPVEKDLIIGSEDEMIVQQAWYCGEHSQAYACINDSRIVGLCFFWHGKRYSERNFWPLEEKEAKLVQLIVLPEMRGRGIATRLIEHSTHDMSRLGFRYLYARIWWSNKPSLHAFERAGWRRIATVIDIFFPYRAKPFRLKLKRMASANRVS
jgi:GNAT superfamily N-acetyltransferase